MFTKYSKIVHFWAYVFFLVGLSFLLFPEKISELILFAGTIFGLSGEIVSPFGSLWHVLSVSLMSIITVCAFFSAKYPAEKGSYYGLMTAKVVSSLFFLFLVWKQGNIWLLCVLADGFVALTLFGARRFSFYYYRNN